MKKILSLLVAVVLLSAVQAQDDSEFKTILGNEPMKISGFGGPIMSFTTLHGDFAHFMGGGGGVIINDFFFGGFGHGITNTVPYLGDETIGKDADFGYGGLWFGYIFAAKKPIHPTFHVKTGWGNYTDTEDGGDKHNCFVVEPTLELEMNVFEFLKFGLGASYRYGSSMDNAIDSKDLSSFGGFLSFKFGWFDY